MTDELVERLRKVAETLTVSGQRPRFANNYLEAAARIEALVEALRDARKFVDFAASDMWNSYDASAMLARIDSLLEGNDPTGGE